MLDIEILNFYNGVKSPEWPCIHSYSDYHRLPEAIKHECDIVHKFQSRKEEICSTDYWIDQTFNVCVYKNLAYVPIPKCAYTYYTTLFNNMGWKQTPLRDVDIENTKFFGLLTHPLIRRLKGITQWLVVAYYENEVQMSKSNPWGFESNEVNWDQLHKDINTKYFKNLLSTLAYGDTCSFPYYTTVSGLLDKTSWIPMDTLTSDQVQTSLMSFFKLHGHEIQLPLNDVYLNVSSKNQLQVYDAVKEAFYHDPKNLYDFYKIYGKDLEFYYNLIDKFTPDWQHL